MKTPLALLVVAAALFALSVAAGRGLPAELPGPTATPVPSPVETGRAIFQSKGCATCHRHDGLGAPRVLSGSDGEPAGWTLTDVSGAPDLTRYPPDPDFVRRWLKNPQAIRPGAAMPDLGLNEEEIEALLAFLAANDGS